MAAHVDDLLKFPRTQHLFDAGGHGVSRDDLVMDARDAAQFYSPPGGAGGQLPVIVAIEEKVDGANLGISIGADGRVRAQNRSHFVDSSSHAQFAQLDQWIEERRATLYELLAPGNDILYGEWLAAKHSIRYTHLPDLFLAFDIYDRKAERFCSRRERDRRLADTGIATVRLIAETPIKDKKHALELLESRSAFYDGPCEGIYLRIDDDVPGSSGGAISVPSGKQGKGKLRKGNSPAVAAAVGGFLRRRCKLVRPDFLQQIEEQWTRQKFTKNIVVYE